MKRSNLENSTSLSKKIKNDYENINVKSSMAFTRRLQKELADLHSLPNLKSLGDFNVDEKNLLFWSGLILPDNPPYNKGAFRIEITFPAEYPFKPPKVTFITKIYHPNIDENGRVCLDIINPGDWRPSVRMTQIIEALVSLVNNPEPEHSLRSELAQEYLNSRQKFMKNAEDYTQKFSEKRTN